MENIKRYNKLIAITFLCATVYIFVITATNHKFNNFFTIKRNNPKVITKTVSHPFLDNPKEWIFGNFTIINKSICSDKTVETLLLVHSSPSNFDRRACYRKYVPDNFQLIFLLGRKDDETQNKVDQESWEFGDIVQGNFNDTFRDLSYKAVMGLTWAALYCSSARYLVKIDDDVFVNYNLLSEYLKSVVRESLTESSFFKKTMFGKIIRGARPQREVNGKWYTKEAEYSAKIYPPYLAGSAYVTTIDVIKDLLKYIPTTPFLWVDDVYITGLLRRQSENIVLQSLGTWWFSTDSNTAVGKLSNKEPYPFIITVVEGASPCDIFIAYENCIQNNCFCCYNDKRKVRKMFNETSLLLY